MICKNQKELDKALIAGTKSIIIEFGNKVSPAQLKGDSPYETDVFVEDNYYVEVNGGLFNVYAKDNAFIIVKSSCEKFSSRLVLFKTSKANVKSKCRVECYDDSICRAKDADIIALNASIIFMEGNCKLEAFDNVMVWNDKGGNEILVKEPTVSIID